MLVWNRRTQTLLTLAIASAAASLAYYNARPILLPAHPALETIVDIVGASMFFAFCATLFAFIVALGDDQLRLARIGRVTAGIMTILWPGFVGFYLMSYQEIGCLLDIRDFALLAGMPIVGAIAAYIGFRK
jgi:hypothetical protein